MTVSVPALPGDATARIQCALDDCFRAGGGTVAVEAGVHRVGGLRVRSGTTLLLRSGAVLEASRDPADFDVLANDALEPVPPEEFAPGVVWAPAWKRKTHDHLLKSASRWNNAIIRIDRQAPGEIVLRDCSLENAERFLHYNFSGNEVWQKGSPLSSIRFEGCEARGVGMSLCAYGDESRPLSLSFERCRFAFAPTQAEFLRAAHVGALSLRDVQIAGVRGPLVRSWGGVAAPVLENAAGFENAVVPADGPFETAAI